ncbi:MAG: hypothetical protein C0514_03955 [Candidatus Puniceispirillum sp.]|nr:hypothetical protein [Candidatus Puniceispirillum sp.]MCA0370494.1 hypothetical protein [Pseudomonadota bacterium]
MDRLTRSGHILKIFFVLGLIAYFVSFNMQKPRILILHSYNTDYSWVRTVNQGINGVLGNRTDFAVHWQYMNTKNHPSIEYKQKMGVLIRRLISHLEPEVIIAVDDDAQNYVAKFYIDNPNIKIIFSGVNATLQDYGYEDTKNVTGVLERVPLDACKDVIPYLVDPKIKESDIRIINLGDKSDTVMLDAKSILEFDWAPLNLIDSVFVDNFDDWKSAVLNAATRADCLFITNYRQLTRTDGAHTFVPPGEVMRWTMENTKIPVLGGNIFVVEDGGNLALAASPAEQGRVAAEMALKILAGTPTTKIPVAQTNDYLVAMRDSDLKYLSRLPKVYRAFARGLGMLYH